MLHSEGLKKAWTSSPGFFWRFLSFARGQYHCTAPARKIRNLSHFLKVYQRVCYYFFESSDFVIFTFTKIVIPVSKRPNIILIKHKPFTALPKACEYTCGDISSLCAVLNISHKTEDTVNIIPEVVSEAKMLNIISRERLYKTRSIIIGTAISNIPIDIRREELLFNVPI